MRGWSTVWSMRILRLAVVFLGAVAIWGVTGLLGRTIFSPDYSLPGHVMRAVMVAALVAIMLIAVARWQKQSFGLIPTRESPKLFGLGALAYAVPFAVGAIVILALGLARFEVAGSAGEIVAHLASVLVLVLIYEAIPEELIFRGYLFSVLRERLATWAAVLVQAALFCAFGIIIGAAQSPDRLRGDDWISWCLRVISRDGRALQRRALRGECFELAAV